MWHQSPQTRKSDTISCSTHECGFTFIIFVGSITDIPFLLVCKTFHTFIYLITTFHMYVLMFYIHFASHKNIMYSCCVTFILNVIWEFVLYPTRLYHILLWQMNDKPWSALSCSSISVSTTFILFSELCGK